MLDSLEASEPMEHDNGAWLSVVAVPSTQPCKDPSGECERAFGMGIFLFGGLTFQVCGDCLQSWAILGVEGVFERPFGDAIALAYELQHGDGGVEVASTQPCEGRALRLRRPFDIDALRF